MTTDSHLPSRLEANDADNTNTTTHNHPTATTAAAAGHHDDPLTGEDIGGAVAEDNVNKNNNNKTAAVLPAAAVDGDEIHPPLMVLPGLDEVSFWDKYVSFGCSFKLLWFTIGLPRALRSSELWDPPTEDKIEQLAAKFDAVFFDKCYTDDYKRKNNGKAYPHSRSRYMWALWAGCKYPLSLSAFFSLLRVAGEMVTPFLTNYLVTSIKERSFEGLYYAIGILVCLTVMAFAQQQQLRFGELALNRCRSVTNYVIFRKAMQIRNSVGITSAEIAVISSQDTQRFIDIAPYFQLLWASPLQIAVGGVLLYSFLGYVGLFALAVLALLYPLIFIIGKLQVIVRRNYNASNSLRILLISEFLQGVNVVKMYGWEHFMKERILKARADELRSTRQELYLWAITSVNMICFPTVTIAFAFLLYVHIEGRLEAADAFATLSLVSILKFPIMNFGTAFMSMMQLLVGCTRIGEILSQELPADATTTGSGSSSADDSIGENPLLPTTAAELETEMARLTAASAASLTSPTASQEEIAAANAMIASPPMKKPTASPSGFAKASGVTIVESRPEAGAIALEMNNVFSYWKRPDEDADDNNNNDSNNNANNKNKKAGGVGEDEPTFVLKNCNLTIRIGEVCAVTGVVGAGKSMLCLTALGETHIANGTCTVARQFASPNGPVAYCSQESFLLSGTIRDNILFHEPFDAQRYLEVLEVCCLWPDFDMYEDGEMTIVGERGITLSGGQKARIALARAVYAKNVALMVIDDPFSALDAGTTKKISSALLSRKHGYLRDRAVLLVTHNRQIVTKYSDHVLQMDDGHTRNLKDLEEISQVMDNNSIASHNITGTQSNGPDNQSFIDRIERAHSQLPEDALAAAAEASPMSDSDDDDDAVDVPTISAANDTDARNAFGAANGNSVSSLAMGRSDTTTTDGYNTNDGSPQSAAYGANSRFLTKQQLKSIESKRHRLDDVTKNRLVKDENFEPLISLATFGKYFYHGGGYWTIFLVLVFLGVERACFIGCDYWLSQWTTASESPNKPDTMLANKFDFGPAWTTDEAMWYWKVYIVIIAITYVLGFNRLNWLAVIGHRAAKNLFHDAFVSMLRCPMVYFDTTPTGRIVNRFSHDTDRIAYPLVIAMNGITATQGWVVSAIIVCAVIMPYTLLVSMPGVAVIYALAFMFRSVNSQLQRLDAASRSNLQAHIHESLYGSVVVRAYGKSAQVLGRCSNLADDNTRSLYAVTITQRWVSLRAELCGSIIGGVVAIFLWIVRYDISPGLAGMAISWGINLSRSASFTVGDGVQADARLVSVDRLCEFREDLREEAPVDRGIKDKRGNYTFDVATGKPIEHHHHLNAAKNSNKEEGALITAEDEANSDGSTTNSNDDANTAAAAGVFSPEEELQMLSVPQPDSDHWPTIGRITFNKVHMRYRAGMPLVLSGASFEVPPGHRIGVIGRTGSGKSSLVQCLFRLRELEGGSICIDGLDIATVGLSAVRGSRMSIIPQDPVLFSGTVRTNVDPFGRYTDQEVIDALKAVSLWARVEREGGLTANVAERGSNFSVGQKQLVCIARAVLRKPTILVMDEATANVDHETDELIQKKVRELFSTTTIFEIAHRLHTVADADLIVVMDRGVVGEIGAPEALLENPESHFSSLVEASGPAVALELREIVAHTAATRVNKTHMNA